MSVFLYLSVAAVSQLLLSRNVVIDRIEPLYHITVIGIMSQSYLSFLYEE